MALTQSHVILGFTGSIGSGCTYIAKALAKKYGYKYFKLSDIIREELRNEGKDENDIALLQDKGNELRRVNNEGILVFRLQEKITSIVTSEDKGVILDGVKNEGEVRALHLGPNSFLFSIHANKEIRRKRVLDANIIKSEIEFEKADSRDQKEEYVYGQQVKYCDYLADIIVLNNENIPETNQDRKKDFIDSIYRRYIKSIEDYSVNRKTIQNSPTVDELCMTAAYSMSKMSNCVKRKVGAVIVDEKHMCVKSAPEEFHATLPILISSGYNEVPLGSHRCIYHPSYQMCYRDYSQQKFGKKIKYCPNCGTEVKIRITCARCKTEYAEFVIFCQKPDCKCEVENAYKCPKCDVEIYKEFIPGSKKSIGKLLDICRALHAEEVALLNLEKNNIDKTGLVLYTTTQPCNLCANKIVTSEIKEVVYTEPYAMKECEDILENGGVKSRRFEGIKSNAFFKLY